MKKNGVYTEIRATIVNSNPFIVGTIQKYSMRCRCCFFTITANGDTDKSGYIPVPIDKIEGCKACWARYLCLGGCPSQKISMGGSNQSAKGEFECELDRLIWVFYIKLYYHIMNLAPDYIKELKQ